jgi:hypothetical protein
VSQAIYEPLIERDSVTFSRLARELALDTSAEELWLLVTRFAVLAFSPSQHGKRTVMACRAAHDVRDEMGDRWLDLIIECGRYAAESRQPWSEPPLLDPPEIGPDHPAEQTELEAAIAERDFARGERWLAARGDDAADGIRAVARGDALLIIDTAVALLPLVGEKGRYPLLRMALQELVHAQDDEDAEGSLEQRIERVIETRGSVDTVRDVLLVDASRGPRPRSPVTSIALEPYQLARDYAQTLIAHAAAGRFLHDGSGNRVDAFLEAVHHNLRHGESYAEWSFA